MYEYQITTSYGGSPPSTLVAPPGFRLRDLKFAETGRGVYNDPMHLTNNVTYVKSSTESVSGLWVAVWERYAPQNEGSI